MDVEEEVDSVPSVLRNRGGDDADSDEAMGAAMATMVGSDDRRRDLDLDLDLVDILSVVISRVMI